ncbi:protein of unknown function [Tepidanaerobacter acetatoxydans Re1]|uniref:Uncharacterized protein n=1 Tax=Tepidanaerobacter acetatoxydans (strain DSM 21804 / JCM 16047 / Re1) TaxID=1209989 RepID=L0S1D7_TEPAE|nr:protein of unknown function [Tepidanaerobacter acetatoxydans Re1]
MIIHKDYEDHGKIIIYSSIGKGETVHITRIVGRNNIDKGGQKIRRFWFM